MRIQPNVSRLFSLPSLLTLEDGDMNKLSQERENTTATTSIYMPHPPPISLSGIRTVLPNKSIHVRATTFLYPFRLALHLCVCFPSAPLSLMAQVFCYANASMDILKNDTSQMRQRKRGRLIKKKIDK